MKIKTMRFLMAMLITFVIVLIYFMGLDFYCNEKIYYNLRENRAPVFDIDGDSIYSVQEVKNRWEVLPFIAVVQELWSFNIIEVKR